MPTKKAVNGRLLTGKARTLGGGARPWRSALYAPTGRYKSCRVTFKKPDAEGVWDWTSHNETTENEGRKPFEQVEKALDADSALPAKSQVTSERTIRALGELYLEETVAQHKAKRTYEQRECKLRAHVNPTTGDLLVSRWRLDGSRRVMTHADKTVH